MSTYKLTINEYNGLFIEHAKSAKDPKLVQASILFAKNQLKRELEWLEEDNDQVVTHFDETAMTFNKDTLEDRLVKYYQDPVVMADTKSIVNSITYHHKAEEDARAAWRVRRWLRNLRSVGTGQNSKVYEADIDGSKNTVIIKEPIHGSTFLLHEYFVGKHLNKLRTQIPNFVYVYAAFKCSVKIPNTQVWCTGTDDPLIYIAYENIHPAVTLAKYIETCTPEQFLNIYTQVLYSLMAIPDNLDFTHYDLHGENVLVRDLPDTAQHIKYKDETGNTIYLAAEKIATIIDYGTSHICVDDVCYGTYTHHGFAKFTMYNRSYKISDMFKLTSYCSHVAQTRNTAVFNLLGDIMLYFTDDNIVDFVNNADLHFHYMPWSEELENRFTLKGLARLIKSILREYPPFISNTMKGKLIKVHQSKEYHDVEDIFDYYDIKVREAISEKIKSDTRLISSADRYRGLSSSVTPKIDSTTAYKKALAEFNLLIRERKTADEAKIILFPQLLPSMLSDINITAEARHSASNIVVQFDNVYVIRLMGRALLYIMEDSNSKDDKMYKSLKSNYNIVSADIPGIEYYLSIIKEMANQVNDYIDTRVASLITGSEAAWWYSVPDKLSKLKFNDGWSGELE